MDKIIRQWNLQARVQNTSISDRMALCNMAVEAGKDRCIFEADEKAIEYLKEWT